MTAAQSMKNIFLVFAFATACLAQASAPVRVLGEAATAPSGEGMFTVKDPQGVTWAVRLDDGGGVVLIEPGAKDLSNAVPVALATVRPGDRLLVRGAIDASLHTVLATSVVVMSKDTITAAKAKEQNEWRTKSITGAIQAVDPAAATLTIKARSAEGRIWTVKVPEGVEMLRYSDDSVRFVDAKPASLADVHIGDQMRILGEKDEAAGTARASRIIFGSFRTLGGEITLIDLDKSQITIRDVQTRKTLVLLVASTANIRRMPTMGNGRSGTMMGRPGGPGAAAFGPGGPQLAGPGNPSGPPNGPVGPGAAGQRRPDIQQMLDRLPAVTISDLKTGDAVVLSAGRTSGPQPWPVVSLVSGMDFLLRASATQVNQAIGNWNMDLPMQ